jgi:hydroxypyruvate isomerase
MSAFVPLSTSLQNTAKNLRASLNPGAIGLQCTATELLDYAISFNFKAISPVLEELISYSKTQQKEYLSKMKANDIVFDSGGLPIQFRASEAIFQQGLSFLQTNIQTIASYGIPSFVTWIMPTHKELTYRQNFDQHQVRLKQIAQVMGAEGLRLGLEYVGPKTLMARDKYPFLHSIAELRELISAIGEDNVGYLLDSFHSYCAGDDSKALDFLQTKDIVSVQVNDAVIGRTIDAQIDQERELPGDTGLIDLKQFLNIVQAKGYQGGVSAEPFNQAVNQLGTAAKLKRVRTSLQKIGV